MTRILITGCTSYIGGHLLRLLRATAAPSATIVGTSRIQPREPLLDEHFAADLTHPGAAAAVMQAAKPDVIYHLAASRSGSLDELMRANAYATAHLLDAVRNAAPQARVIVAGSSAELGYIRDDRALDEHEPPNPVDPYGISKLAQSAVAGAAALAQRLDVVRLRIFNVTGPGSPEAQLQGRCARLLAEVRRGAHAPTLEFGDLHSRRDYTDVRDVCRAFTLAADRGEAGELYHIGSGIATSGREVVDTLVQKAFTDPSQITIIEAAPRTSLVPVQRADASRAHKHLRWEPTITLEQSLQDTWEHEWASAPAEAVH